MRIGVLGTGIVGRTLASKLVSLGHEVMMSSRRHAGDAHRLQHGQPRGEDPATDFGWPAEDVMDLGGIQAARGLEMYLPLWLGLYGATGTAHVTIKVVAP